MSDIIDRLSGAIKTQERLVAGGWDSGMLDLLLSLRSEAQSAREDAARYRWLRDKHPADLGLWVAHGVVGVNLECWRNEVLDAAIDAAIAQEPKHG